MILHTYEIEAQFVGESGEFQLLVAFRALRCEADPKGELALIVHGPSLDQTLHWITTSSAFTCSPSAGRAGCAWGLPSSLPRGLHTHAQDGPSIRRARRTTASISSGPFRRAGSL